MKKAAVGCLMVSLGVLALASACLADDDEEAPKPGLRVGGDLYYGLSNITGPTRRMTDGAWAAVGTLYPSVLSLNWAGNGGDSAVASLGVGDMYVGSERTTQQPVECFYRRTLGSGKVTLGKHYTPFALQEWEYETRWGAMYEVDVSTLSLTVSTAYNKDTRAMNTIGRVARKVAANTTVGISGACGRGWSYCTSHAWGYGMDVETGIGAVTLSGEFLEARGRNGTFQFAFAKVMAEAAKGWRPYVGAYYGHDVADEMGELRSCVLGVEIDAMPHLVLEPGVGRASGRNVWWAQAHVTF